MKTRGGRRETPQAHEVAFDRNLGELTYDELMAIIDAPTRLAAPSRQLRPRRPFQRPLSWTAALRSIAFMVVLIAAVAYLVGLAPALLLAAIAGTLGWARRKSAEVQRRRVEAFRDLWSHRFHGALFRASSRSQREPLSPIIKR